MKRLILSIFLLIPVFVFAGSIDTELRIENNNVVVYKNDKKIDTLTVLGNATQEYGCELSLCIGYNIIGSKAGYTLVQKWTKEGKKGTKSRINIYIYDLSKRNSKLIDITQTLHWSSIYRKGIDCSNDTCTESYFIDIKKGKSGIYLALEFNGKTTSGSELILLNPKTMKKINSYFYSGTIGSFNLLLQGVVEIYPASVSIPFIWKPIH